MTLRQLGALLKDHPWRCYTFLNLMLIVLEKLVEIDFVCPCRYGFTWAFFLLYLAMPFILALNFGVYICKHWTGAGSFLLSFLPIVIWLLLFFGEGRYVACLMTSLKADYADSSAPPWEWCDSNRTLTAEQNRTKEGFLISKIVVFAIIIALLLSALVYQCVKFREKDQEIQDQTQKGQTVCKQEMKKLPPASDKSTRQSATEDSSLL